MRETLGGLPLIAEDLGQITPEVDALRREVGLPGTRVLQFAFGAPDSPHAPHRLERAVVVYTGTHDNDTTVGWYRSLAPEMKQRVDLYTGSSAVGIERALIRLAYTSVADLAIVPAQDVLGLRGEARMNLPGCSEGNWEWRLPPAALDGPTAAWLRSLAEITDRLREPPRGASA